MKKILFAFTLVELIVVISIITLLTTSSVFYFFDFVKEQEISQKLTLIEDNLKDLDKKVKKYEIFDYELHFNTSNSWSYITYINNFDLKYNQTINLNSWTWTVILSWASSWTWIIKLYKKQKLFLNKERQWNNSNYLDLSNELYYKIAWSFSGEILNDIHLNYFSEENLYPENNDSFVLIWIYDNENKTNDINPLIIRNIWWKKEITWNSIDMNEVYLFFENSWIEKFIKITK